jgi:hypothetical protein
MDVLLKCRLVVLERNNSSVAAFQATNISRYIKINNKKNQTPG